MKSKLCTAMLVAAAGLLADTAFAQALGQQVLGQQVPGQFVPYGGNRGYGYGGYGYGGYGSYSRYGRSGYGYGLGGFSPGGIISSLGQYNLSTSQAAINYQQAYSQYLDNQKKQESTYFDMRRMHASYRSEQALQHPAPTADQLAAFSKSRTPQPLSSNDLDPAHGVLNWPTVLRNKDFDADRHQVEGLFAQAAADPHASGLGTENYRQIQHAIGDLNDKLHSKIDQYSADEYISANKFLKSLAYQARTPIEVAGTAK